MLPICSSNKAASIRVSGTVGCYGEAGVSVHSAHLFRLYLPIFRRILDDAESIDPEISDVKRPSYVYRITEGLWQI